MAHTYVVDTNTASSGIATLTGSVDGIPVTITYMACAIQGLTLGQAKNYVAALMLDQAIPPVINLPTGTFTQ